MVWKHPKTMYLLSLAEMVQRFAFWGVASILVLYLRHLNYSDSEADSIYGIYTGVGFFLPLLGGYLADKIGYKIPVILGCYATAVGCFLLATAEHFFIFPALFLIALGGGIFTPGIYAILGRIYHNEPEKGQGGFSIYYAAVNIGVFLAMIILGAFQQGNFWKSAFAVAGFVQLLALIPLSYVIKHHPAFLRPAGYKEETKKAGPLTKIEKNRMVTILILSLFSIFFWMAYNQAGSSMTIFAQDFTNRSFLGKQIPTPWFNSIESLFLVVLAFPLAKLYEVLDKKKCDPSIPTKSSLSFFFLGTSFIALVFAAKLIPTGSTHALISPKYLMVSFVLMAIAEMLIAPIGLSLVTNLSPKRYTASLVGVWYVCIGLAFYLGGLLSARNAISVDFFKIFVYTSWIPAIILFLFRKNLNKLLHIK